jgi:Rrf2 family protein
MFKINRKIEYALIALNYMRDKSPEALTSAKEICDVYLTPFDPTSRVLQIMTQHGVLRAEQGARGGYRIIRDLKALSVKSLSDMIAGPIRIANCFYDDTGEPACEVLCRCQIASPLTHLNDRINDLFADISVEELLRHQENKILPAPETEPAAGRRKGVYGTRR